MEVADRSLPPGEHLGARLLALRRRIGMSRRQLSAASQVCSTSIAELEAGRLGHLALVERVSQALG
jgi:transcriptional regulator with XRE-family HTH domain